MTLAVKPPEEEITVQRVQTEQPSESLVPGCGWRGADRSRFEWSQAASVALVRPRTGSNVRL
jgi:hypothetical protein